ncbi:hypothetical protein I79_016539 [Cricetulus griseus]|uniref:Uncharacterized protein n=1 Tax=Cricetulus griseus TaxID=10029 RepID=G3HZN2_CRIGR|nr:hypothetical protein I79_016539 [Cricetulus griseus]
MVWLQESPQGGAQGRRCLYVSFANMLDWEAAHLPPSSPGLLAKKAGGGGFLFLLASLVETIMPISLQCPDFKHCLL